MKELKRPLPEFEEPPVIETVLGVQFTPMQDFSILYYGLYWTKVQIDYPKTEIQPPLPPIVEQFDTKLLEPAIGVEFVQTPDIRCWCIDSSETRLIQIQKDRFIHNWRKVRDNDVYPRYNNLKPKFEEEWQRFCDFLHEKNLTTPDVNQCEVTYINQIEIGKGCKSYGEVDKIVAYWTERPLGEFLPNPERVHFNVTYLMPEEKGRLYITLQPGIRRQDGKEVLQLNLTARGRPISSTREGIMKWFDMGHEWIVRGFADFTTKEMHKIWRRKL